MVGTRSGSPFCPLLKKSSGNPYMKILDFSLLFIADAPLKTKNQKFRVISSQGTFGTPSKNQFGSIKKPFYKPYLI